MKKKIKHCYWYVSMKVEYIICICFEDFTFSIVIPSLRKREDFFHITVSQTLVYVIFISIKITWYDLVLKIKHDIMAIINI